MKKLYLQRGHEYMMSNAVKMMVVSIYKESFSVNLLKDQVFIQDRVRTSRPITQAEFEYAYEEVKSQLKLFV